MADQSRPQISIAHPQPVSLPDSVYNLVEQALAAMLGGSAGPPAPAPQPTPAPAPQPLPGADFNGTTVQPYVFDHAPSYGLDPAAVLAVASVEGLGGGVGDGGTSFGPWQLHAGGALPANIWAQGADFAAQWAWSPPGIDYALGVIGSVASGLTGLPAVTAIVRQFERPADPTTEVANAWARYSHYL